MANYSLMYEEDHFVLLMPGQDEEILTVQELQDRLVKLLSDRQQDLPRDLTRFSTPLAQAQHLLKTACELELQPGRIMQWYAIRLEK